MRVSSGGGQLRAAFETPYASAGHTENAELIEGTVMLVQVPIAMYARNCDVDTTTHWKSCMRMDTTLGPWTDQSPWTPRLLKAISTVGGN